MERKLEFYRNILRMLYQALFTVLFIHSLVSRYTSEAFLPSCVGAIFGCYIISYFIRNYAGNNLIVFLVHGGMIGSFLLVDFTTGVRVFLIGLCLFLLSNSFRGKRYQGLPPVNGFPLGSMLAVLVIYFLAVYQDNTPLIKECYVIPIIMIFVYLAMMYLDGLREYIHSTHTITGLPLNRIIYSNSVYVLGLFFILLVAIFILGLFRLDDNALMFGKGILAVFALAFYGFIFISGSIMRLFSEDAGGSAYSKASKMLQETGKSRVGEVLEMLVQLALLILVLYGLYRFVRWIGRWLLLGRRSALDIVEKADTNTKIVERREDIKQDKRRFDNEAKIRLLYKNHILRYQHYIKLNNRKSARTIEHEILENEIGNVNEVTNIYSRIRYGKNGADKALVKYTKELTKE